MDDILKCPICNTKLKTSHHKHKLLHPTNTTADYAERMCHEGYSHVLSAWTNKETQKVDLLRFSIDPKYSRIIDNDYVNQRCRLALLNDQTFKYIEIPKLLVPDFPDLCKFKEAISVYVLFS